MGSAIKWYNKSKEYWVHFATEMGAAHFICLINSTLSMESRQAMQIPDIYSDSHTDEHGKTCSKGRLDFASETTQKDAERFLHNTLRIPKKDIWKIEKEAPNDDATTVSRWTFRVKSPDTIRLLGSFRLPTQPKLVSKHGRDTDFHVGYATGWKAYEDRLSEIMESGVGVTAQSSTVKLNVRDIEKDMGDACERYAHRY